MEDSTVCVDVPEIKPCIDLDEYISRIVTDEDQLFSGLQGRWELRKDSCVGLVLTWFSFPLSDGRKRDKIHSIMCWRVDNNDHLFVMSNGLRVHVGIGERDILFYINDGGKICIRCYSLLPV